MSTPSYRPTSHQPTSYRPPAQDSWRTPEEPWTTGPGDRSADRPADGPDQQGTAPLSATVLMAPAEQRLWATLGHLSPLVVSFVGPLVLFLALKDRGSFVRHHAAEALNLQITLALVGVVGSFLGSLVLLVTFGIGFSLVLAVGALFVLAVLTLQVVAAVRANRGLDNHYPLTLRLVR